MRVETLKEHGRIIEIHTDDDPMDPREWDNLGHMACWHRDYQLGDGNIRDVIGRDDFRSVGVMVRYLQRWYGAEVLPLGLIDHSVISMYVGDGAHMCDPGGWDSGQVGVIYATADDIRREYGDDTPENRETARSCMRSEVETYDQYLRGDVYGYVVKDTEGNVLDSCWGLFYGTEDVQGEAIACAELNAAPTGAQLARLQLPWRA